MTKQSGSVTIPPLCHYVSWPNNDCTPLISAGHSIATLVSTSITGPIAKGPCLRRELAQFRHVVETEMPTVPERRALRVSLRNHLRRRVAPHLDHPVTPARAR